MSLHPLVFAVQNDIVLAFHLRVICMNEVKFKCGFGVFYGMAVHACKGPVMAADTLL